MAPRRLRGAFAFAAASTRLEHRGPFVDTAAREELLGGRPLELQALGRRSGELRRLEVHTRGLRAAPRPLEHLPEARVQIAPLGRRGGEVVERQPQEARGAVEGQLACGLLGGAFGEASTALGVPRAEEVSGDGLGIAAFHRAERVGEAAVVGANGRLGELGDDEVADAAVARLDDLVAVAQPGADEAVRAGDVDRASPPNGGAPTPRPRPRRGGGDRRRRSLRACGARLPGRGRAGS